MFWLTGKLGRAWVGAWVGAWWCLGVGSGLDGDGEGVVGVVSCEMGTYFVFYQNTNPAPPNPDPVAIHDTATNIQWISQSQDHLKTGQYYNCQTLASFQVEKLLLHI